MSTLVRTQILLTAEQRRRLRSWSRAEGKTPSELIREAIQDRCVRRPAPEGLEAALRASFGGWKERRRPIPCLRGWLCTAQG
jgi:hypothetical protein